MMITCISKWAPTSGDRWCGEPAWISFHIITCIVVLYLCIMVNCPFYLYLFYLDYGISLSHLKILMILNIWAILLIWLSYLASLRPTPLCTWRVIVWKIQIQIQQEREHILEVEMCDYDQWWQQKLWKLTTESFSLVTSCSTSDMKYGRIPRRSTMFIAPFTNLMDLNIIFCDNSCQSQILRKKSTLCSHLDLCGAAMNLTTYSKENQPTKTASAISKKYSSPESCQISKGAFDNQRSSGWYDYF